jgi:hypothetical protein
MAMSDDAKWHWGEATKYVIEGAKTILIVNGAASVSTLTFIGNVKFHPKGLIWAMILFAIGAMFSAMIFACAYFTQLYYGNSNLKLAHRWHIFTYVVVIASFILFFSGIVLAAWGFFNLP